MARRESSLSFQYLRRNAGRFEDSNKILLSETIRCHKLLDYLNRRCRTNLVALLLEILDKHAKRVV